MSEDKTEIEVKYDDAVADAIAQNPFLSVIYQKKGFIEKFHAFDYENQIKAYQTLVKLASDSNENKQSRNDAFYKLERIMESIGLYMVEQQNCYLSKDERLIIRMDFYGSIDRIQAGERKRKLSVPYLELMNKPCRKRPKMRDYDFKSSPVWPLFARFKSFRKIENNLKRYLVKNKISPEILSIMNVRDFSDLIVHAFQTDDSQMKIEFQKPTTVRKKFVMDLAANHGDEIEKILASKGYDKRYIASMLNAMKCFGATKTEKLVITETHFTQRALNELKKHGIECKGYKKDDPISQELINRLIAEGHGIWIAAYDENGQRLKSCDFPSFEVHHKHAVSTSGDLFNTAAINYKDNLCLVLTDIHTHVLHGMDIIVDDKRDAYSRRTEFFDEDVAFMAGFEPNDKIYISYANTSSRRKKDKEDSLIHVLYDECMAKLYENQNAYEMRHKTPKQSKKSFDVDAVVKMVNQTYEKKPVTRQNLSVRHYALVKEIKGRRQR